MTTFGLSNVPNQKFSTKINGKAVSVALRAFRGLFYASVWIDGECLESGSRAVSNASIFGSSVNNALGGRFAFVTDLDRYFTYEDFGNGVDLVFIPFGTI